MSPLICSTVCDSSLSRLFHPFSILKEHSVSFPAFVLLVQYRRYTKKLSWTLKGYFSRLSTCYDEKVRSGPVTRSTPPLHHVTPPFERRALFSCSHVGEDT